jgi:hypothetical protein
MLGALAIFREYPLLGSGLGTFGDIFYRHEPAELGGVYWIYTHNDWLQLLAEAGLSGFLLGAAVLVAFFLGLLRAWRRQRDPFARDLGLGGLAALGAAIIYSLANFPFHIPALTFTFAGIAALTYLAVHSSPGGQPFTYPLLKFPQHRPVARWIIPCLMAAQLAFAYQVCYHFLAEIAAPTAIDSTRGPQEVKVEDFRRALALNPRNSRCYLGLAEALERGDLGEEGAAGEVERSLQSAVFQAPANWGYHLKLAEFYLRRQAQDPPRYVPLALEELAAVVKLYPESPGLHLHLASVLAWAEKNFPGLIPPGLINQSAFHYWQALRLDPGLEREIQRKGLTLTE